MIITLLLSKSLKAILLEVLLPIRICMGQVAQLLL